MDAAAILTSLRLVAQAPAADPPPGSGILSILPGIIIVVALFWMMIVRPEKRKQQAQKDLLDGLKKNDRVVTIGGIYGVVMDVDRPGDKVTLKIDESNNTKIKVTFG